MVLLLLLCFWFGQGQQSAAEDKSTGDAQQQATQSPSPVIKAAKAGQSGNEGQDDQANAAHWSDPLIVLNLLLFMAVVIQAAIYGWQLYVMRKTLGVLKRQADAFDSQVIAAQGQLGAMQEQLDAMKEQAGIMRDSLTETRKMVGQHELAIVASQTQAAAAQLSAQAAKQSAAVAKESLNIEQRAYVAVRDMKILNLTQGTRPTITITWINGGRTPAWNLRCLPQLVLDKPDTNAITFIDDDFSDISASFLPAGQERSIDYLMIETFTPEEIADLSTGRRNLFVVGTAIYRDARGEIQRTEISAMFDWRKGKFYECYEYAKGEKPN